MDVDGGHDPGVFNNILVVANILNTYKITNMSVPDLVQSNTSATLDCEVYADDEQFTLSWLLDGEPVYVWAPYGEPDVRPPLQGRVDLAYRPTRDPLQERRALRIPQPTPELSGQYACAVTSDHAQDSREQYMLVFSPEEELSLSVSELAEGGGGEGAGGELRVTCAARRVYPQPLLELHSDQMLIQQQELRVWRSDGPYYDAVCTARVPRAAGRGRGPRVACRLLVPQAGYSALRELEHTGTDNAFAGAAGKTWPFSFIHIVSIATLLISYN